MHTFHILNGDCLQGQLNETPINGVQIVVRECLLVGDVFADSFDEFIKKRAAYISEEYGVSDEDYAKLSKATFQEILQIPEHATVFLWFENDLFCQVNMWYVLSLLSKQKSLSVYRVFPPEVSNWDGFATVSSTELVKCYENAVPMQFSDIQLASDLWEAFTQGDTDTLEKYASVQTKAYRLLPMVCNALIDDKMNGTVVQELKNIVKDQNLTFEEIFERFSAKMGVFGYGDLQIRSILKQIETKK